MEKCQTLNEKLTITGKPYLCGLSIPDEKIYD